MATPETWSKPIDNLTYHQVSLYWLETTTSIINTTSGAPQPRPLPITPKPQTNQANTTPRLPTLPGPNHSSRLSPVVCRLSLLQKQSSPISPLPARSRCYEASRNETPRRYPIAQYAVTYHWHRQSRSETLYARPQPSVSQQYVRSSRQSRRKQRK